MRKEDWKVIVIAVVVLAIIFLISNPVVELAPKVKQDKKSFDSGDLLAGEGEDNIYLIVRSPVSSERGDSEEIFPPVGERAAPSVSIRRHFPVCTRVWTAQDLDNVRNDLSACYIQMADIDLQGYGNWRPIGSFFGGFLGIYDGNNKEIRNLEISREEQETGLFGQLGSPLFPANAEVKNLILRDVDVKGRYVVGALAGGVSNAVISNVHVIGGTIQIESIGGGLFGQGGNWIIQDSSVEGVLITNSTHVFPSAMGGLVGAANVRSSSMNFDDNLISNSYVKDVTLQQGTDGIGGLAGFFRGTIERSYAKNVNIKDLQNRYGGGIVGYLDNHLPSSITDTFSLGTINHLYHDPNPLGTIGGLVGNVNSVGGKPSIQVSNSYSGMVITPSSPAGGLIGWKEGFGGFGVVSSYWDNEMTNIYRSAGGVGKTTAEMRMQSTFVNWNFNSIWDIAEDITYPFLKWQLEEGLVAHYKFDELANGKTPDSSLYGYDADVFGATLWQWGKIDRALNFSGWRGRVIVEDTPFLYLDEEMTISAWINTRRLWKPWQTIVWKGEPDGGAGAVSSDNREFAMFLARSRDPNGVWRGNIQLAFTPENRIGIGQISCTTNTFPIRAKDWWYHVAGTIDVENQKAKIYVNGELVKTCSLPSNSVIRDTNGPLVVGNKMPLPAGSSAGFTGKIDDFRLYNKVLSDTEILSLYKG
ncbi:MAG: hypothetical protein IIA87_01505 [Nanoarchaeota archaeon]|nr:hypothetical protein [Nanoarchaeota archaeon]